MPRKALWFVAIALIGVFVMIARVGHVRSRVVVINQSGEPITDVTVAGESVGTIDNGQSHAFWVDRGDSVVLSYRIGTRAVRWQSAPEASLLITIGSGGAVRAERALSGNR